MTLEILDGDNALVRRFSSADKPEPTAPTLNVAAGWIRPFQPLSTEAGMHRFIWDLHAAPGPGGGVPSGPDRGYSQPLVVKPDPRAAR